MRAASSATNTADADAAEPHRVRCRLALLLAARNMTPTDLSERVGVSVVNLSVLKNDRARAIRYSTLTALCDALDCQPGDLFIVEPAQKTGGGR